MQTNWGPIVYCPGTLKKNCVAKGSPRLKNAGKSYVHGILDKEGIKPHKNNLLS
jgi:hypothetical protein